MFRAMSFAWKLGQGNLGGRLRGSTFQIGESTASEIFCVAMSRGTVGPLRKTPEPFRYLFLGRRMGEHKPSLVQNDERGLTVEGFLNAAER